MHQVDFGGYHVIGLDIKVFATAFNRMGLPFNLQDYRCD